VFVEIIMMVLLLLLLLQALAAEKASRDQQRLAAAARPLAANLMGGVLPAVMAGLVKVALSRPADPCQVSQHSMGPCLVQCSRYELHT
jgi:hypothetical protein